MGAAQQKHHATGFGPGDVCGGHHHVAPALRIGRLHPGHDDERPTWRHLGVGRRRRGHPRRGEARPPHRHPDSRRIWARGAHLRHPCGVAQPAPRVGTRGHVGGALFSGLGHGVAYVRRQGGRPRTRGKSVDPRTAPTRDVRTGRKRNQPGHHRVVVQPTLVGGRFQTDPAQRGQHPVHGDDVGDDGGLWTPSRRAPSGGQPNLGPGPSGTSTRQGCGHDGGWRLVWRGFPVGTGPSVCPALPDH